MIIESGTLCYYLTFPCSSIEGPEIMSKHLYFLCPTDHLEMVINQTFKHENYYYSSLGNSLQFEARLICEIATFIKAKEINKICFVLAGDNRIVLDAIGKQAYTKIRGLAKFYAKLSSQKNPSEGVWQTWNPHFLILSYHLYNKMKEIEHHLLARLKEPIKMEGKIYNKQTTVFDDLYPYSVCQICCSLN